MAFLHLLADLDAERINGGYGRRRGRGPSFSVRNTTVTKRANTNLAQGNIANNLALGLGLDGFGAANASSWQSNVAYVTTEAD
jgi:hypothetical protein